MEPCKLLLHLLGPLLVATNGITGGPLEIAEGPAEVVVAPAAGATRPSFHGDQDFHHHHGAVVHPGPPETVPKADVTPKRPVGGGHIDLDYHHVHGASRVEHMQPFLHLDGQPDRLYLLAAPAGMMGRNPGR
jgi:hypothetical protein